MPFWHDGAPLDLNGSPGAFFDFPHGQLVILLPNAASAGGYKQLHYGIANGADAAIAFSLKPPNASMIEYAYIVNDDPQARQRSLRFYFLLPSHDSTLVPTPGPWGFGMQETTIPDRTAHLGLCVLWGGPTPLRLRIG